MSRVLLTLIAAMALVGCGEAQPTGDIVQVVPASGVLTLKGKPLAWYQVAAYPQDNRPAMGVTDAEGRFRLGTNMADDGAVVGSHRVAVTFVGPPNTNPNEGITEFSPPPVPKEKMARKYASADTSGLTIVIPEGGTTELKLDLQ
jgi:hypothetical protein